jgi:hypothetical protein
MAVHHQNHLDDGDNYKSQRMQRMYRKKFSVKADPTSPRHHSKYSRYEKWSRYDLDQKASEFGIEHAGKMSKQDLIDLLSEY